ncbi:cytidine deaminase [Rhodopila sp.]|jgi:cytidine deaminase|uniref:cytidine deaminase n=1 Tax=Rhodopila sp. TaxID=2480087 RepID=UPI002C5AD426|nr:cytidine deaminase [Rhodopila sp.]HVZ09889.1 cytidine deaminase [Rhodopila sp.]
MKLDRMKLEKPKRPHGAGFEDLTLSDDDHALIAAANAVLERHYRPFWHTVAAAIRSQDGRIWTGIHLGTTVGRLAICAEAVALGRAVLEGDGSIATAVAVRHPKPEEADRELAVVSPCGGCREMIMDHAPEARIILQDSGSLIKLPIRSLLVLPYRR